MLVLDRTLSMCWDTYGNTDPSCTDLNNAREGMRTFLGYLDPEIHWVGLGVFPPAQAGGSGCAVPKTSYYNSVDSPYVIVPLSNDYKVGGELNESSTLVSTIDCQQAGGQTAYANAIEAAQAELDASGRPEATDVVVFLSDGAANYGPRYYPRSSLYRDQPCHQGVWSASSVKSTGTLVYTIGYDLNAVAGSANVCRANSYNGPLEQPPITAFETLQQMATDADTFFNQPGAGELHSIYTAIAAEISGTRLLPEELG